MTRTTEVILGHQIEIENDTGDLIDYDQLREQIELGDKQGNLYWNGLIVPIGRWKIVNEWKKVAEQLYYELYAAVALLNQPHDQITIFKKYEELIKKEGEKDGNVR